MAKEIELKLELPADGAKTLRGGEFSGAEAHDLQSVYYDTADRRLLQAHMTLRLRSADGRWLQTVKGEGDGVTRFEDEVPVPSGAVDRRGLGRGPIAALIDGAPLEPVFETRVRRRTRRLAVGDAVIELALDEGEAVAGALLAPIRELELELKSGTIAALFPEARRFVESTGAAVSLVSKAERGNALAAGRHGQAVKFSRPTLDGKTPVGEAFQILSLAAVHQVQANTPPPTRAAAVEAVHQARIGLRRLRAMIAAFEAVAADGRRETIKTELRRLGALFAEARSLDVFIDEAVKPFVVQAPGVAALLSSLEAARARAHARIRAEVIGTAYRGAILDVVEWICAGDWRHDPALRKAAAKPIADVAPSLLTHRRKRLRRRAGRLDWEDPHARHALRIEAKGLRYLADAFSPLFGDASEYLSGLGAFLNIAGRLNDLETAPATIGAIVTEGFGPESILAAGMIIGERSAERPRLIRDARRAFETFDACKRFW